MNVIIVSTLLPDQKSSGPSCSNLGPKRISYLSNEAKNPLPAGTWVNFLRSEVGGVKLKTTAVLKWQVHKQEGAKERIRARANNSHNNEV